MLGKERKERELDEVKTPILIAGLPGKMATLIAEALTQNENYYLLPIAIASNRHVAEVVRFGEKVIQLVDSFIDVRQSDGIIAIDFTIPQSAVDNAINYARLGIPFVMGTTGGNREILEKVVKESKISAVIAPNMAVEVVALQDELNDLLQNSPRAFEGWQMTIRESHQAAKKDVSGTAIAFRIQLEALGAVMEGEIESIRDPEKQRELGIQNLGGHAYHWIRLVSPDGKIKEYQTAIEGRQPYVEGTLMAVEFLRRKIKQGSRGEIFTMSDVIRARI